jgi:hypothetical protein
MPAGSVKPKGTPPRLIFFALSKQLAVFLNPGKIESCADGLQRLVASVAQLVEQLTLNCLATFSRISPPLATPGHALTFL